MLLNNRRIALIPAYQPENTLPELVCKVKDAGFTVVVVDDGGGPEYTELFDKVSESAIVLTHHQNHGKGRAIKTGLAYIDEHFGKDQTIVTMDSDGQHQIEDAVRVCRASERRPDTLVLGSRKLKDNVPLRSQFGNTVTRFVFRLSTGQNVHDTQTGLRAFSSALIKTMLVIPGERYEYEMNVLLEFSRSKLPIEEMEIATIYFDNNAGSHFDTVKDSYRIYKEILKFSASSLLSFCIDYGMYSLLSVFTASLGGGASLMLSNVLARVVSASVNFSLNRKWVFKSNTQVAKSATQYILLAGAILIGNTFVLSLLVEQLGMNRYVAKLITELLFFAISWLMQRFVIFGKKEARNEKPTAI